MKLSVLMITFNHEKFITQAVDSVLHQQTNFDFEIVIGEDCSTDRTRDLLIELQRQHPEKIRLLLHETNVGAYNNLAQTFQSCQGQYVAWLEGDDYWTCSLKLQKQVDYLDNHPECTICFHDVLISNEETKQGPFHFVPPNQKEVSTIEDLLLDNFVPSCSVVFRNQLFHEFPSWFQDLAMADWPLHILNANYGNIGYIPEVMGVHRNHAGGVWSPLDRQVKLQKMLKLYDYVNPYLTFKYDSVIKEAQFKIYLTLSGIYSDESKETDARACLSKCIKANWQRSLVTPQFWKYSLKLYLPTVFYFLMALKQSVSPRK
jgi:glycosyltransferase involved in cell wall biosynthesis